MMELPALSVLNPHLYSTLPLRLVLPALLLNSITLRKEHARPDKYSLKTEIMTIWLVFQMLALRNIFRTWLNLSSSTLKLSSPSANKLKIVL
jgi:hypothetical protein